MPLNVDLDVVLSVLASAICAALRQRLPATTPPPDTSATVLQTSGVIHTTDDTITVGSTATLLTVCAAQLN